MVGTNIGSKPLLATLYGDYTGYGDIVITATNASGALTFQFHSDYSGSFSGWKASIQCVY